MLGSLIGEKGGLGVWADRVERLWYVGQVGLIGTYQGAVGVTCAGPAFEVRHSYSMDSIAPFRRDL